jgi:hypothetical protein
METEMIQRIELIQNPKDMKLVFSNIYDYWVRDDRGKLVARGAGKNMVVTAGLNDCLDKWLKGSSYTAAWYLFLKGSGTIALTDTMASHAGWSEITGYSEAVRQTVTLGTVAAGAVNNSASKCVFTANASIDVYGGGICSNNTKGGSTGTLLGVSDFDTNHTLSSGYTITIQTNLSVENA